MSTVHSFALAIAIATTVAACGDPAPPRVRCADVPQVASRACIDEGWFELSRWSTSATNAMDTEADPVTPTLLDAFAIDRFEVTNAELAEFLLATGRPPLPAQCGMQENYGAEDAPWVIEVSGWIDGAPPADRLDHPAVCVTRAEAIAFCARRGGRLVSAFEYLRAARGPAPDRRPFPWGTSPPPASKIGPWPELPMDWHLDYATLGAYLTEQLQTRPVDAAPLGVSPDGVHGLAGNASELLAECGADVAWIDEERPAELVRPGRPAAETCEQALQQLVGGSNWRSVLHRDTFGAAVFKGRNFFSAMGSYADATATLGLLRKAVALPAPLEDRNWRIGFRCAYDLIARD